MADFLFNEQTHFYILGERKVPSVTEIIGKVLAGEIYGHVSPDALARGKRVHELIRIYEETGGALTLSSEDLRYEPFIRAWVRFRIENPRLGRLIIAEEAAYSERYRFAGRWDGLYGETIVDYKTGAKPPIELAAVQTAPYMFLAQLKGYKVRDRLMVNLRADGTYATESLRDFARDFSWFLGLKQTYDLKIRLGQ